MDRISYSRADLVHRALNKMVILFPEDERRPLINQYIQTFDFIVNLLALSAGAHCAQLTFEESSKRNYSLIKKCGLTLAVGSATTVAIYAFYFDMWKLLKQITRP